MYPLLLGLHTIWLLWMIAGVILALLGFRYPRLWAMTFFRFTHLLAILGTASVPLWAEGICPLTALEGKIQDGPGNLGPFIVRLLHDLLYWDVPAIYLSLVSAGAAFVTLIIFILHPPWHRPE
jgi:hypothetical protein